MDTSIDEVKQLSPNAFPVVGIGASAGGLEAFKKLIGAISADSGMAYVLVQHLDPKHESILPMLLQKVSRIPVVEITDEIKVEPNHIYIIPSNKMLEANDGVLQISPRPPKEMKVLNLPIDVFFTSLAEVHQEHSIGVVLSGNASDGTAGLTAIKNHGGITFAQTVESAAHDSMPQSATLAGVVDFILSPEEIPAKLLEIKEHSIRSEEELKNFPQQAEDAYRRIIFLLKENKGVDFTYYKQSTIRRRIARRMTLNKSGSLEGYLAHLSENRPEQDALCQDLLIQVTSFFRDQKVFEDLCASEFPLLIKSKSDSGPVRVWIPGCSTGQEAYSMAICLTELLSDRHQKVQIFATDISEPAIAKARGGNYTNSEVAGISDARLRKFFSKTKEGYRINKDVRESCVFAVHNFVKDPPFGKIDFLSCRNALIYMEPYLQKRALTTFHYALNPKGLLLLGKTESIGSVPELFAATASKEKIFVRKSAPGRFTREPVHDIHEDLPGAKMLSRVKSYTDFQKAADNIILGKYATPGVVINAAMDIVQFRGNTSCYLLQAPGKPTHNLLKMAPPGLAFELRSIIQKAKTERATVKKERIAIEIAGVRRDVTIEVVPLQDLNEPYYLILFQETRYPDAPSRDSVEGATSDDRDRHIVQLEAELLQAREDMRAISEDQEAVNEELQSANEEFLSGNEELQSLNEELETSKEELQSSNEQLISTNDQLTVANQYAESIITTIREPLLVLDKTLRIKTANNAFYRTFRVAKEDTEGVLIYDLGNKQWNIPALRKLLEEILPQHAEIVDFEVGHEFPYIGERIMQLNGRQMSLEGSDEKLILLAIEDVTEKRQCLARERELLGKFEHMVLKAPVAICILRGKDYVVELANDFYLQMFGKEKSAIGKPIFDILPELKMQGINELLDKVRHTHRPLFGYDMELSLLRNGILKKCYFNLVYLPMPVQPGTLSEVIMVITEVTATTRGRNGLAAAD